MIQSFRGAATEDFFQGRKTAASRRVPTEIHDRLARKLDALNAAQDLRDLTAMPGNRLEELSGKLAGKHSIRLNHQWRVVFRWTERGPEEVEWTDYH